MHHPANDEPGFNESRCLRSTSKKIRFAFESSKQFHRHRSTIFDLPTEVLEKIFDYLLVRERGNVKLVCRQWCQIFHQTAKFLEDEKLICSGMYRCSDPSRDILGTLARSTRESLFLEFHYFEFRESDLSFWQQCGRKIRALRFSECSMTSDTLLRVILHCPNLKCLSWCVENVRAEEAVFCPAETMDRLLSCRVTNANLVSLSIRCARTNGLSNFILGGLFALFPAVKKLAFWFTALENHKDDESPANSRTSLTLDCVLRHIASLDNIAERLDLTLKHRNDRHNILWHRLLSTCEFKNLREVTLDVSSEMEPSTVYSFFTNKTHLESVKLRSILGGLERIFGELSSHMFDSCPKLRHLRLESRPLSLAGVSLGEILKSRLTTLCIRSPKLDVDPEFWGQCLSQKVVNTRLRTLVLDGDIGETVQMVFILLFPQLHTLELSVVTDKILQCIWKYQTDLVSLKLWRAYYTTDYGFTGIGCCGNVETGYSVRRLSNLEYLTIESSEEEWMITSDTFVHFVFPKLRYFVLDVYINEELHDALLDALRKLQSLNALSLKFVNTPFGKCFDLCKNLNNLRYLRLRNDTENARKFTDAQCQRLFKRRPSLRALIHECNDSTNVTYFFDVLETKPKKKISRRLHRLPSEKIGIYFVDCLWF